MSFLTLEQAKAHLRVDFDADDDLIEEQIEEASAIVLNYLKDSTFTYVDSSGELIEGTSGTFAIRAATKIMLTVLYSSRGEDGGERAKFMQGYPPPAVTAILYPLRDPAFA